MAGKQSRQERVANSIARVREAATAAVERSKFIGLPTLDPSVCSDGIISAAELQGLKPDELTWKQRRQQLDETVEQQAERLIESKPEIVDSSAEKIATTLECSKQMVMKTTTWGAIMLERRRRKNDRRGSYEDTR